MGRGRSLSHYALLLRITRRRLPEMDPFTMVVAIVFIGCAAGLGHEAVKRWSEVERAKHSQGNPQMAAEVKALREEMRQLREQNADMILSFDTALTRLGAVANHPPLPGQSV